MMAKLKEDSFDTLFERGSALAGTPDEIVDQLRAYDRACGGFEYASVQFFFSHLDREVARASLDLFAAEALPALRRDRGGVPSQ